jgi:hypothetical protein
MALIGLSSTISTLYDANFSTLTDFTGECNEEVPSDVDTDADTAEAAAAALGD